MSNAKQAAPTGTAVTLGGREYRFKYTLGFLRKLEELTGINPWSYDWSAISPRIVHACIWAQVAIADRREYTAEEIDDLYPLYDDEEQVALGNAIAAMFLEANEEREKKKKAKKPAEPQKPAEPETVAA